MRSATSSRRRCATDQRRRCEAIPIRKKRAATVCRAWSHHRDSRCTHCLGHLTALPVLHLRSTQCCDWSRSVVGSLALNRRWRQGHRAEALLRVRQDVPGSVLHPRVSGKNTLVLLNADSEFRWKTSPTPETAKD